MFLFQFLWLFLGPFSAGQDLTSAAENCTSLMKGVGCLKSQNSGQKAPRDVFLQTRAAEWSLHSRTEAWFLWNFSTPYLFLRFTASSDLVPCHGIMSTFKYLSCMKHRPSVYLVRNHIVNVITFFHLTWLNIEATFNYVSGVNTPETFLLNFQYIWNNHKHIL